MREATWPEDWVEAVGICENEPIMKRIELNWISECRSLGVAHDEERTRGLNPAGRSH